MNLRTEADSLYPEPFATRESKVRDFELIWINDFFFYKDFPQIDTTTKKYLNGDQADIILTEALAAFKAAFKDYAVHVGEGHKGTNTVYIEKGYYFDGSKSACGLTSPYVTGSSQIFYQCNMEQAQFALESNVLSVEMLKAIGRGIGNNAAHEIGHQLKLPGMDDNSTGTYNGGKADDPAVYNGTGLHWEDKAAAALRRILGMGQ